MMSDHNQRYPYCPAQDRSPAASLGLVSPEAATDGVIPIFS